MSKRVKLNPELFAFSSIVERMTRAKVKDCYDDETTLFVIVFPGNLRKAIGKGGENIRKLQAKFSRRIKIVEFSQDPTQFVQRYIYPLKVEEIRIGEDEIIIKDSNRKTKSLLIGRDAKNLRFLNDIVSRYYNLEVKII